MISVVITDRTLYVYIHIYIHCCQVTFQSLKRNAISTCQKMILSKILHENQSVMVCNFGNVSRNCIVMLYSIYKTLGTKIWYDKKRLLLAYITSWPGGSCHLTHTQLPLNATYCIHRHQHGCKQLPIKFIAVLGLYSWSLVLMGRQTMSTSMARTVTAANSPTTTCHICWRWHRCGVLCATEIWWERSWWSWSESSMKRCPLTKVRGDQGQMDGTSRTRSWILHQVWTGHISRHPVFAIHLTWWAQSSMN